MSSPNIPARRNPGLPAKPSNEIEEAAFEGEVIDGDYRQLPGGSVTVSKPGDGRCPYCGGKVPVYTDGRPIYLCWHCGRGQWGDWQAEGGVLNGVAYDVKNLVVEGLALPQHASTSQDCTVIVLVPNTSHGKMVEIGGAQRTAERYRINGRNVVAAIFPKVSYNTGPGWEHTRKIHIHVQSGGETRSAVLYSGDLIVADCTISAAHWANCGVPYEFV